MKMKHDKK